MRSLLPSRFLPSHPRDHDDRREKYETRFTAKNIAAVNKILFILGQQTGTVWIDDFTVTKEAK
jgi:hypothetical protein